MSSLARVTIHSSQFPESVRSDLIESLRKRQVNHKFHYDSVKQTHQWLALHQAYSPSRMDPDCETIYNHSFEAATDLTRASCVHLIGLGCGGGQKDARLLSLLVASGKQVFYSPTDVSTAMVLVARQATLGIVGEENCSPLVCDLATADDLTEVFESMPVPNTARLITFFGMLPNFEPRIILPRLAAMVRAGDYLLLSANLAPGRDYEAGVRRILPLYDNCLTRDWLMTFLQDLGVEKDDGELRFGIENDPSGSGPKRITANFHFAKPRELRVDQELFAFQPGESMRLFFSFRHTPALVRSQLAPHGLEVLEEWITRSEEEGVFLVKKLA
jgi:uncharacterized SAM-dependent methyltransferase